MRAMFVNNVQQLAQKNFIASWWNDQILLMEANSKFK